MKSQLILYREIPLLTVRKYKCNAAQCRALFPELALVNALLMSTNRYIQKLIGSRAINTTTSNSLLPCAREY